MTVSERLKDLVELSRLKHTRDNEIKIGNHLIAIRKHIEEQDEMIEFDKTREADLEKCLNNANNIIGKQKRSIADLLNQCKVTINVFEQQNYGSMAMNIARIKVAIKKVDPDSEEAKAKV